LTPSVAERSSGTTSVDTLRDTDKSSNEFTER
jgi:hypothetical protein